MSKAKLTITSKNYGAWSLRGWLLCKFARLDFDEVVLENGHPSARAELLLLAPSFRVPCLNVDDIEVWDTLSIGEYLAETYPESGLLPADASARAHCRSVSGEMHSGFNNLRAALPMNARAQYRDFKVWSGVEADIERICAIWAECLDRYGGPFLFGKTPTMADAMFAPACLRFHTYGISLDQTSSRYRDVIWGLPEMQEWVAAAKREPDTIEELDAEF